MRRITEKQMTNDQGSRDSERSGRGERIRTSDLTVPNRALYQAEPRPDKGTKGILGNRMKSVKPSELKFVR